jgi:hypothetical protein
MSPKGIPGVRDPKNHLQRRKTLLAQERDRLPEWLDEHLPRGVERVHTVRMLRRRFQNGCSRETLAADFSLPLSVVKKLCPYRVNQDPSPKHTSNNLLPCPLPCPACEWEAAQILRLGPVPPPAGLPRDPEGRLTAAG